MCWPCNQCTPGSKPTRGLQWVMNPPPQTCHPPTKNIKIPSRKRIFCSVFGNEKNKKGIDFLNPMEFYSLYFEILSFLLGFDEIWIDFNFKYLERLFCPSQILYIYIYCLLLLRASFLTLLHATAASCFFFNVDNIECVYIYIYINCCFMLLFMLIPESKFFFWGCPGSKFSDERERERDNIIGVNM